MKIKIEVIKVIIASAILAISGFVAYSITEKHSYSKLHITLNSIMNENSCFFYDVEDYNYPNAENIKVYANANYLKVYYNSNNGSDDGAFYFRPNNDDIWGVYRYVRNEDTEIWKYEVYEPISTVEYDVVRNLEIFKVLQELSDSNYVGNIDLTPEGIEYLEQKYNTTSINFSIEYTGGYLYRSKITINYQQDNQKVLSIQGHNGSCMDMPID